MDQDIQVVNIMSVSFSGSTWLNLMLGSHDRAFSVGELKKVLGWGKAVCTLHGEQCPVWSRYDSRSSENPFAQIARITGKRCLVVNNSRQFLPSQQVPPVRPKFIHLIRDGRAVVASMLRKEHQHSVSAAARLWSHDVRRNRRLMRRQPREDVLEVSYEHLKADPAAGLKRICAFLGLDFQPSMTRYEGHDAHYLSGNRGTLHALASQQQADVNLQISIGNEPRFDWDLDHYRKTDPTRFVDERWKHELSNRQLRVFALLAGRLNRRLGYPRALDRG